MSLPAHERFRVKLGDFVLGWIIQTDVTVRYLSHLDPLGSYADSVLDAMNHFHYHVPAAVASHLVLEPMEAGEVR